MNEQQFKLLMEKLEVIKNCIERKNKNTTSDERAPCGEECQHTNWFRHDDGGFECQDCGLLE